MVYVIPVLHYLAAREMFGIAHLVPNKIFLGFKQVNEHFYFNDWFCTNNRFETRQTEAVTSKWAGVVHGKLNVNFAYDKPRHKFV